jgi:chromosome segregation protein
LNVARAATQTARRAAETPAGRRDHLTARLAEARGALTALEAEQRTRAAMREGQRTALTRLEERLVTRRREAEARASEIAAAVADRDRQDDTIRRLAGEVEAAEAAITPQRERLAAWTLELTDLEPASDEQRKRLTELERRMLASENEVRRRSDELARLREEMADEGYRFEPLAVATGGEATDSEEDAETVPVVETPAGVSPLDAVARSGATGEDEAALHDRVRSLLARIRNAGAVTPAAASEYAEARERHDFLSAQAADLREAETGL